MSARKDGGPVKRKAPAKVTAEAGAAEKEGFVRCGTRGGHYTICRPIAIARRYIVDAELRVEVLHEH